VHKLFSELGPRYAQRPGGYLRILKFGLRVGDSAPMALVELMDRPDLGAGAETDTESAKGAQATKTAKTEKATKTAKAARAPKAAKPPKTAKAGKTASASKSAA